MITRAIKISQTVPRTEEQTYQCQETCSEETPMILKKRSPKRSSILPTTERWEHQNWWEQISLSPVMLSAAEQT